MTPAERRRAKEICEKATPAPWHELERCDNAGPNDACGVTTNHVDAYGHRIGVFRSDAYDECWHPVSKDNATFIAESRTLLPAALAHIDRLETLCREACDIALEALSLNVDYDGSVARQAARIAAIRRALDEGGGENE